MPQIASIREAAVEAAEKQQRDTSNRLEEQRRTAEEKGASTAQLLKETQDELKQVRTYDTLGVLCVIRAPLFCLTVQACTRSAPPSLRRRFKTDA